MDRSQFFNYLKPHWLIYAIILVLVGGCDTDYDSTLDFADIGSKIEIDMIEKFTNDGVKLAILSSTEKIYPCSNYSLVANSKLLEQENKIVIEFVNVYQPEICLDAQDKARATHFLDLENGRYGLELVNMGNKDIGILTVTDEAYQLEFDSPKYFSVLHDKLMKIPEFGYWVYYNDTLGISSDKIREFQKMLEDHGATLNSFSNGYYGNNFGTFYVQGSNFAAENTQIPQNNLVTLGFTFKYTGSWESLKKAIRDFIIENKQYINITVYTYRGEVIS